VPLQVNVLGILTLDFKGGIKYRIEANIAGGLGGVKLKIIGMEFSADSPVLGMVTLSQADIDVTPLSLLEVTGNLPPKFRNTLFWDFTLTIEKPPGGGPPMVLSNTKTATMLNDSLTTFPPQGSVYQLQQPVDLAPVGAPEQLAIKILPKHSIFPVATAIPREGGYKGKKGGVYPLQQPIDLAPVGAPNQVVAQLLQFPMTMSHNP
jgi:hypothetical protein